MVVTNGNTDRVMTPDESYGTFGMLGGYAPHTSASVRVPTLSPMDAHHLKAFTSSLRAQLGVFNAFDDHACELSDRLFAQEVRTPSHRAMLYAVVEAADALRTHAEQQHEDGVSSNSALIEKLQTAAADYFAQRPMSASARAYVGGEYVRQVVMALDVGNAEDMVEQVAASYAPAHQEQRLLH